MKIKIGESYRFPFAGSIYEGELMAIEKTVVGTVTHIWYKCKHKDGTIYPVRKEDLTTITKKGN